MYLLILLAYPGHENKNCETYDVCVCAKWLQSDWTL